MIQIFLVKEPLLPDTGPLSTLCKHVQVPRDTGFPGIPKVLETQYKVEDSRNRF